MPMKQTPKAPPGDRLEAFIADNGLRKTWAAEQLDISRQFLHQLTTGNTIPSLLLAWRIERFTKRKVKATDWVSQ